MLINGDFKQSRGVFLSSIPMEVPWIKGLKPPFTGLSMANLNQQLGGGILMIRTTNHRHAQTIAGWWFNGIMMINDG